MTVSDEADNAAKVYEKKGIRHLHLIPLIDEEEQTIDDDLPDASILVSAELPTVVLPRIGSSKGVARSNPHVIRKSSPSFEESYEYSPVCEQETMIIPVIQISKTGTKVSVQNAEGEKEDYAAYIRKLITSSGIYALSSLASPLVSLILAPFLTHHFTHTDYGALAVLNTAISLLAGLTQLGLGSAFFRSYNYDYETSQDRLRVLSTVVDLLLGTSVCAAVAMIAGASWLSMLLLNSTAYSGAIATAGLVVLVQNLTIPGFAWMRAESRAAFFSLLSIANLAISLGANIILVGFLHMGIVGSLIATGSGYAVVSFCTLPVILFRAGLRPRLDVAQGLLSFGLPNVSTFISVWVLQLSDRFLLGRLGSLSQTASYAVAYSLGSVVNVVVLSPFTLAWPSAMFSIAKRDDAAHVFQTIFRWYRAVLFFSAFGLTIAGTIILYEFFPPAYHAASPVIPTVVFSSVFYGLYNFFTTGISVRRQTWYAVLFTTISALVNVALNLYLIPLYGSMGAALSTLIAYAVLALVAYIVNQRIYPIPFEISSLLIEMFVGVVLFVISTMLVQKQEMYTGYLIYGGTLVLYAIFLVLFEMFIRQIRSNKHYMKQGGY